MQNDYISREEKMEEYISREAAINAVYNGFLKDDPFLFPDQVRETNVYKKMCEVPAADVRPVVRGEWRKSELFNDLGVVMDWHRVECGKPIPFVPVLVRMPGEKPFPTVREGFVKRDGSWYAGGFDRLPDEVTHWAEMPNFPGD